MPFIAGPYTATWNALAVGQPRDGFRTSHQLFKKPIIGDSYGDARQDAIYRGASVEVNFVMIEYDAAAVATIIWPNGASLWSIGQVGTLDVAGSLVKQLVLTRVSASTPATPSSLTMARTALKEGFPIEMLLAADLKEVPMSLAVYPNNSGVFAN